MRCTIAWYPLSNCYKYPLRRLQAASKAILTALNCNFSSIIIVFLGTPTPNVNKLGMADKDLSSMTGTFNNSGVQYRTPVSRTITASVFLLARLHSVSAMRYRGGKSYNRHPMSSEARLFFNAWCRALLPQELKQAYVVKKMRAFVVHMKDQQIDPRMAHPNCCHITIWTHQEFASCKYSGTRHHWEQRDHHIPLLHLGNSQTLLKIILND